VTHAPRRFVRALLLAALVTGGCARSGSEKTQSAIPADAGQIGSQAADFELTDLSGKKVRLSDFKGHVMIVDFWAPWCGPCVAEIPDFVKLQSKYRAQKFTILGLTVNSDETSVRKFAEDHDVNYPLLLEADETTKIYGGVLGIPTTFVVDRQGKIVKKFIGAMSPETFEEAIQPLLAS
jgi:cytochrome c biogenesis protein CcmG/thiol:disulfide interchange protein DsbE